MVYNISGSTIDTGALHLTTSAPVTFNPPSLAGSLVFTITSISLYVNLNQPSAVILSPEEYTRLTEIEEDYMLLLEANSRLEANGDKPGISFTNVLNDLGISESDLDDAEEVAIE